MGFPSRDGAPSPPPLSPFSSFIFFPTCFWRQWSAFLVVWCPLPAYRSCFVEFAQRWNVLLRNLWGRKWSSRPIPLPSFSDPSKLVFKDILLQQYLRRKFYCVQKHALKMLKTVAYLNFLEERIVNISNNYFHWFLFNIFLINLFF